MNIVPTGGALGARVDGLDLRQALDRATAGQLYQTLIETGVLLFRQQSISEEDQVRFTSYFGRPVEHVRRGRSGQDDQSGAQGEGAHQSTTTCATADAPRS